VSRLQRRRLWGRRNYDQSTLRQLQRTYRLHRQGVEVGTTISPRYGNFNGRTDFDALAVWRLDNLGFGNYAVQKRVRAELGQTEAELAREINQVRSEVAEALAQSEASRHQVDFATRQVRIAEEGYRLDLRRTMNRQGRIIEVLNSAVNLNTARQNLIRAIVSYNQAQFRLFVALGQPPL